MMRGKVLLLGQEKYPNSEQTEARTFLRVLRVLPPEVHQFTWRVYGGPLTIGRRATGKESSVGTLDDPGAASAGGEIECML